MDLQKNSSEAPSGGQKGPKSGPKGLPNGDPNRLFYDFGRNSSPLLDPQYLPWFWHILGVENHNFSARFLPQKLVGDVPSKKRVQNRFSPHFSEKGTKMGAQTGGE